MLNSNPVIKLTMLALMGHFQSDYKNTS